MCRKRLSCPRCRSELIDSAWVVIVPGQKCIKKKIKFEIDTGSGVTVISEQTYLRCLGNLPFIKSNIRIKTYTNEPINVFWLETGYRLLN